MEKWGFLRCGFLAGGMSVVGCNTLRTFKRRSWSFPSLRYALASFLGGSGG
jgi:hypothetical protein